MPEDTVFTVQEVAKYLRMQPVTIYKHAKCGKLPCFKVGANWRFKKSTIDPADLGAPTRHRQDRRARPYPE